MAVDYTTYPAASDATSAIQATGLDVPAGLDLQQRCDDARSEWEQLTSYGPFLGDTVDVQRVFDAPGPDGPTTIGYRGGGRKLYFIETGLLSITSVTVNALSDSSIYVQGQDFFARPSNAPANKRPWTHLEFVVPLWTPPEGIVILGKWGYATALLPNQWGAILGYALYLCRPYLSLNISGGAAAEKDDRSQVNYVSGPLSPVQSEADQWYADFVRRATSYQRKMIL